MEYAAHDLIWTKNVKREQGDAWAYMEYQVGDIFPLNWPKGRFDMGYTDARKVPERQLILIFQSVNRKSGAIPGTYLTHIVSPIDSKVDTLPDSTHPYTRKVVVIARNSNPIPKPSFLDFREPNRGWACPLQTIKPLNKSQVISLPELQNLFWDLFENKDIQARAIIPIDSDLAELEQQEEALEGEEKYRISRHKYYERDPSIIAKKKAIARKNGNLSCEACLFDFGKRYNGHGTGFIECHHIYPIAGNGIRTTRLEDLALVCSNCHRMLHRRNVQGSYYSVGELRDLCESAKSNGTLLV